jgi:hypothetical protein
MQVIFEKRLTASEKERHWIIIPARVREHLPPCDVVFDLKAGSEIFTSYIDRYKRLRLGSRIFDKLLLEEYTSPVVVEKQSNNVYVLRKKKE